MPLVQVHVWKGFGDEKAKIVIREITRVFTELGVPAHAVEVLVHKTPRRTGGLVASPPQRS